MPSRANSAARRCQNHMLRMAPRGGGLSPRPSRSPRRLLRAQKQGGRMEARKGTARYKLPEGPTVFATQRGATQAPAGRQTG
eukprot:8341097-Pyramimonas_sp.AAC.1